MRPLQTGLIAKDDRRATPGFTLYTPLFDNHTYLLNMEGEIVHQWDIPDHPGGYARLLPNGNLFSATKTDGGPPFPGGAAGGLMREVDWDGNTVHEYIDDFQHHDFRKLPNGNIVYTGWEKMPEEAAKRVQGGVPGTDLDGDIYNDYLREVNPDGETVWEWHAHSDMDIEKYPLHPLCPRRVYAWCNTVFPMDNGDVMISMRQINLVAIIDRETKRFKWEMRDDSWGHQHDCQMLKNGNIMMFANGMNTYGNPHPHSSIIEIDPETRKEVWAYRANPEMSFYSHHISGAERLDSGNTLICEGSSGHIFEVTPEGDTVWEYVNPRLDKSFADEDVNWVFRAFRYAEDSPEIAGRLSL